MGYSSQIPGFYKMSLEKRLRVLRVRGALSQEDIETLGKGLSTSTSDMMVENVVGQFQLPLGIAINFRINNRDYLVPMVTEEPSVVAAASHAAKLALPQGFQASSSRSVMRGQIQVIDIEKPEKARERVLSARGELMDRAERLAGSLPALGGGVIDLSARVLETEKKMLIVEFFVDCRDAMGANAVNTIAEGIAPEVETISGGRALLRILSNLATERIARAKVVYKCRKIGGSEVAEGIVDAYSFAAADPYRATTHNKGIMNGVTAVIMATANDTRAVEAGAHAYASLSGKYLPLSKWRMDEQGDLVGEIELPLAVGTVGGATKTHPVAQVCMKLMGIKNSNELAEVACSAGLAQNFAALRALVTEGIQKGHMELHARNVAVMAGAKGDRIEEIAKMLVMEKNVRVSRAKEMLQSKG